VGRWGRARNGCSTSLRIGGMTRSPINVSQWASQPSSARAFLSGLNEAAQTTSSDGVLGFAFAVSTIVHFCLWALVALSTYMISRMFAKRRDVALGFTPALPPRQPQPAAHARSREPNIDEFGWASGTVLVFFLAVLLAVWLF
jgi:hypothetical protein